MFTHNVEAEIFERHAARAKGLWRLVWADQSRKMTRFEGETLRRFDTVIAVSKRDADVLSDRYRLARVEEIDTGVDLDFFAAASPDLAADPGSGWRHPGVHRDHELGRQRGRHSFSARRGLADPGSRASTHQRGDHWPQPARVARPTRSESAA